MTAEKPHTDTPVASSPQRILEAAEKLFANNGFASVSLRQVTSAAGVNLAAVHYHFGSKDGLIEAVLRRNIQPINDKRIHLLDQYEIATDGPLEIEDILDAFLRPGIEMNQQSAGQRSCPMQLYGRIHAEADHRVHSVFFEMFSVVATRFRAALRRALPHLTEHEIAWRMHFIIGTMAQTCSEPERVQHLSGGEIEPNAQNTLEQMIPFLAAGLRCEGTAGQIEGADAHGKSHAAALRPKRTGGSR